jgi:hypothetical protein
MTALEGPSAAQIVGYGDDRETVIVLCYSVPGGINQPFEVAHIVVKQGRVVGKERYRSNHD